MTCQRKLHERLQVFALSLDQIESRLGGQLAVQEAIDDVFSHPDANRTTSLPEGLSGQSLGLVRAALPDHGEMSASDCAELTGMARVSTRRYLEYLVLTGDASMRLQYGAGRPIKMFLAIDR